MLIGEMPSSVLDGIEASLMWIKYEPRSSGGGGKFR
jgi:hypothetical protein